MQLLRGTLARIRALLRRDTIAGEIREELQFHLDMRVEQFTRQGLTSDDARRRALRRFGNPAVHQEHGYDIRGGGVMETVLQDLRYSVRLLRAQPGFAITAILTLAIGVALSTTLFTVIHAAVINPLPYPDPEQLVTADVTIRISSTETTFTTPSVVDARTWRADGRFFSHVAVDRHDRELVVEDGEPTRRRVQTVSENYFETLGVTPILGRTIHLDDTNLAKPFVVLAGHHYWQTQFGGDPGVLGRVIRVNTHPATIVGVLPAGFYPEVALWDPIRFTSDFERRRGTGAEVIARLRPGVTIEAAAAELSRFTDAIDQSAGQPEGTVVRLSSMYANVSSSQTASVMTLSAAVGAILLIACVNVAGLLLVRGASRQRELAVRASIGAGRWRLMRQLLTESVVLAMAAGLTGVVLAWLTLDTLIAIVPLSIPASAIPSLNLDVLVFAAAVAMISAVLFGIIPALRLSRVTMQLALGNERTGSALPRRSGQSLIAIEVTLAVVLLAGASLMVRSFTRIVSVDLGFDADAFLTMEVAPVDPSMKVAATFYPALVDAVRLLPGVETAGASNQLPIGGARRAGSVRVSPDSEPIRVDQRWIIPGYFEAIGLEVKQGRLLSRADLASARSLIVINELAARRIFPNGPAVGRRIPLDGEMPEVIGVVGNMLQDGAQSPERANVYWLFDGSQTLSPRGLIALFVRPRAGARDLIPRLREVAQSIGPPVVIHRIRSGEDFVSESVVVPRRRMQLLGLLGGVGLLLTLIGVFSVTAYTVARRRREIGIRMALGARATNVVRTFVGDAVWPVGIGLVAGLGTAYLASRAIASLLYETAPHDPAAYASAAITLACAAVLAAWLPARRAARIDPVSALRGE